MMLRHVLNETPALVGAVCAERCCNCGVFRVSLDKGRKLMAIPIPYVHGGIGILTVLLSIPLILRIVPMNRVYGIRIRKAFISPHNWYAINAYGGKLLLAFGLVPAFIQLAWPRLRTAADQHLGARVFAHSFAGACSHTCHDQCLCATPARAIAHAFAAPAFRKPGVV